jgi:hypothetical protein
VGLDDAPHALDDGGHLGGGGTGEPQRVGEQAVERVRGVVEAHPDAAAYTPGAIL